MSSVGGRLRDWFNGGDPDGRAKLRAWARGHDGRPEGYTYGMMGPAVGLSVLAALLYAPTRGYGSIVALVLAIFLLLGRQMIERQVARDAADLREAERQYERTANAEYLEFTRLRAGGLLEDNKMLTRQTRTWLSERIEWAQAEQDKLTRRTERAQRRRSRGKGRGGQGRGSGQ
ncbi:hypothetical protein [Actinomyces ruminicola]|uniref:Uncharacterized protein n=1 Tax=Actinomyces ruminicola TaxID=332524 RepID=A0A1G9S1G8_9ACTO|nr:hypothetical protein [Actinomyces ruminicola]SDM29331.1 hypothetical protein SAMN04487766_101247 [Actinomyces ruminicola]